MGSLEAQISLGIAYLNGLGGTIQSPGTAALWLAKAAGRGDATSQTLLAALLLQGWSASPGSDGLFRREPQKPDRLGALHWAIEAAKNGHPDGQALLGFLLSAGHPTENDRQTAIHWYRRAVAAGSAQGYMGLAILIAERAESFSVAEEAAGLMMRAAHAKLPAAMHLYGVMLEQGFGIERSIDQAVTWYQRAATSEFGAAQTRYGLALMHGRGVPQDRFSGESWLRRAALKGECGACVALADVYSSGDNRNDIEAARWYAEATKRSHNDHSNDRFDFIDGKTGSVQPPRYP